jgi:hypothetical protein
VLVAARVALDDAANFQCPPSHHIVLDEEPVRDVVASWGRPVVLPKPLYLCVEDLMGASTRQQAVWLDDL